MKRVTENAETNHTPGRLRLTGDGVIWLLAAVLLAAVGWYKSINLIFLLAYLMLALLVVNGVVARAQVRRLVVRRAEAAPVYAGEPVVARAEVRNTGQGPATAVVEERVGNAPLRWFVHRLGAAHVSTCEAVRVVAHRGQYAASLRVLSAAPLGLVQAERRFSSEPPVVVLPACGTADPEGLRRWLVRESGEDGRARRVLRRITSEQAEVRGVRPYRPGDSLRLVHWRSTARRGQMMVREFDAAPALTLVLVVEPWLPVGSGDEQRAALEAALSLAATVARTWHTAIGASVLCVVAGQPDSLRSAGPSEAGLRLALAPLASVTGGATFSPLGPQDFKRPLARTARLVVSSRPASPYAAALAARTGRPFVALSPADRPPWYSPPVVTPKTQRG